MGGGKKERQPAYEQVGHGSIVIASELARASPRMGKAKFQGPHGELH